MNFARLAIPELKRIQNILITAVFESNHTIEGFTRPEWQGTIDSPGVPMFPEQMLQQLETMTADPRFRAMTTRDLQNILTAIELCGLGFNHGSKVAEDLNFLIANDWPARKKILIR